MNNTSEVSMNEKIDVSTHPLFEPPGLPPGWKRRDVAINKPDHYDMHAVRVDGLTVRLLGSRVLEERVLEVELLLGRRPYVLVLGDTVRLLRSRTLVAAALEAERVCPLPPLWLAALGDHEPVDPKTGELRFAEPAA